MDRCDFDLAEWDSAIDDFLIHKRATKETKTVLFYKSTLKGLKEWAEREKISLQDFRGRHLSRYLDMRKREPGRRGTPVTDRTRRHDAVSAKVFFAFCAAERLIETNPLSDYEVPGFTRKIPKVPTTEEVGKILRATRDIWEPGKRPGNKYVKDTRRRFHAKRNYALIAGLVTTACRIGEMLTLKLEDYHPGELFVTFRDTKTDEDREVPIYKEWVEMVEAYLKVRPKKSGSDYLFVSEYGEQISVVGYCDVFKDIVTFAGVPHCTLHLLRHYAATQLAERDLLTAKEILGHKRIETTMIYTHASKNHIRRIHSEVGLLAGVLPADEKSSKPVLRNKRTEAQKRRKLV